MDAIPPRILMTQMKASLSNVMWKNHVMIWDNGGDTSPRNPNINIRNPMPTISLFAIDDESPPPSLLDQIKPFVFAKLKVDVGFLSWRHSERAMSSNEIIVQGKSVCHVLSSTGIVHTSHNFGALLQSVMPSLNGHILHTLADWRYFEVNRLRVCTMFDFLLHGCIVCLQGVTNDNSRKSFCILFAFLQNLSSIISKSSLVNLRGKNESGLIIHEIPKPVVVAFFHFATSDIYHGLVNMPDTANVRRELGNVCFHDPDVSLNPIVNGRLPDLDTVKLHKVVSDLPKRDALEVQVHAKSNHFCILLHTFKTFTITEFVMTDKTGQTLNLAKLGVSIAVFLELDTLAFRTTEYVFLLLIENRIANLDLLSHLQRKLDTQNVLTVNMTVNVIRTGACPCQTVSVYVIVKLRSLRSYSIMSGIDTLEHVSVLGNLKTLLFTFRENLTHEHNTPLSDLNFT
jgi:hypothetical protein